MHRRDRQWSRALARVVAQANELRHEVEDLRKRGDRLEQEVAALRQRQEAASGAPGASEAMDAPAERGGHPGPVIHVYLVNGQDFYGVVTSMDDDSFSIAVSNSAGRVAVIPKRNILYYRMKY